MKVKNVTSIIIWGSLWGLFEATVGYVLHNLSLNIGWFIWFPAALFFMSSVYKKTHNYSSVFLTSLLAASVKLINFLMPVRIDKVLNPAFSIVFEGISVIAVLSLYNALKEKMNFKYLYILSACVLWRLIYIVYILFTPLWIKSISPLRSADTFIKLLITEPVINSIFIFAVFLSVKYLKTFIKIKTVKINKRFQPVLAVLLLVITVLAEWKL